ncbi:MAG: hypothetical protein ACI4D7_02375 [Lachnospiraceae bacterium]
MIRLRDFARERGVTDRQVQRLLKKYEAELTGKFERRGQNGTWLTDEACDFLIGKMRTSPVVVGDEQQLREQMQLQKENEQLLRENKELWKQIADLNYQLRLAAEEKTEQAKLLTAAEGIKEQLDKAQQDLDQARNELDKLKNAGFWERIRGWK